jgi:SAM-dependent methyltransferase
MYGDGYGYRSGLNRAMVEHLARKARGVEALVGLGAGDVVLDIGSNDGTLLASYETSSIRRLGIDPTAARFAEYYPPDAEVVPDFFSASAFWRTSDRPARIITSIAMFYDLDDPVAFACDVRDCLAPDGVWHFEQSYMPSMLRSTAYDTVCHEHLEYYSLATARRILDAADLELVDVRFNRVNGGSFAVTAAPPGAPIARQTVLVDWFMAQEERLGLHTPGPFRAFEERVFQHRTDLIQLIRSLRDDGASVMGYGASTKGNVLLQFCGFTDADIEAIAEVNPNKFGRVTPGSGIPIVPEQEVRDSQPDYLVVFPWHFRDGIIEREEAYLLRGGRLIFPLPEIDFGDGITSPGATKLHVLNAQADIYFRAGVADLSVIDVGCWDGFNSFEAKRRGAARVLATDHFAWSDKCWGSRESFELARANLGLAVEVMDIDLPEIIPATVGHFDLVLFCGVLYHLRDPLGALERISEICSRTLVVESHLDALEIERPSMIFYPTNELANDPTNWWGPNPACVTSMLKDLGFPTVEFTWHPVYPHRGIFHGHRS